MLGGSLSIRVFLNSVALRAKKLRQWPVWWLRLLLFWPTFPRTWLTATAVPGTRSASFAAGIKAQNRRLRGDDGGCGKILRETPAAALGSWGHCSASDNCDCAVPALPDGILEAMADAEVDPGYQPLLPCAGKCSALRAQRRR